MKKRQRTRRDQSKIRKAVMEVELPLQDLRHGLGALSALYGPISIEEAGVGWIADKLSESLRTLETTWLDLLQATRE